MIAVNNKKFILEYWTALSGNEKTPELIDKYISDPELKGHIAFFEAAFPKYEMFADDFICEDDKVVVRAHAKCVHKGDFMGIPPTGKTIEVPFAVIYQIENGKIAKSWLFTDRMNMIDQLEVTSFDN